MIRTVRNIEHYNAPKDCADSLREVADQIENGKQDELVWAHVHVRRCTKEEYRHTIDRLKGKGILVEPNSENLKRIIAAALTLSNALYLRPMKSFLGMRNMER